MWLAKSNENPVLFAEKCPVVEEQCDKLAKNLLKKGEKRGTEISLKKIAAMVVVESVLRVEVCLLFFFKFKKSSLKNHLKLERMHKKIIQKLKTKSDSLANSGFISHRSDISK